MTNIRHPKWGYYSMKRGSEFEDFWDRYLEDGSHNILYILGEGFDPRMCLGFEALLNAVGRNKIDCLLIQYDEGPNSPSIELTNLVARNTDKLKRLISRGNKLITRKIQMWSDGNNLNRRRTSSINAIKIFSNSPELLNYSDIMIDISAMPRSIYFSLIGKVMKSIDSHKTANINLHIVAYEDPVLDQSIEDIGIDDDVQHAFGFGTMQAESLIDIPRIWIPILGEGKRIQLEKIHESIRPIEICPVLPHPSKNPQRSERLIVEYRDLLFDQWQIEPKNIVYASEWNPFDVYRQIWHLVHHYDRALQPLGGCKATISAHSSKLLSIGAILAAYELKFDEKKKVGIVHVEAQGYTMTRPSVPPLGDLFSLWVMGDCYAL